MTEKIKSFYKTKTAKSHLKFGPFEKLIASIPGLTIIFFSLYIVFSLLLNAVYDNSRFNYVASNTLGISCYKIIICAVLVVSVIAFFGRKIFRCCKNRKLSDKQFYISILGCFSVLFILQLFIAYNISFRTDWDAGAIITYAEKIAFEGARTVDSQYFSSYPNNLPLVYTLALLFKIGSVVLPSMPYGFVLAVNSFFVCSSVCLSVFCIYKITENRTATLISTCLGMFLIGLSPWITVPYTDTIGMIFPSIALFFYLFVNKPFFKYLLCSGAVLVGYLYKPTIVIVMIAIVALWICSQILAVIRKRFSFKKALSFVFAVCLAATFPVLINKSVDCIDQTELNPQSSMTATHYLMMGFNKDIEGMFSQADVDYSWSFPDIESRQKANIEVFKQRVSDMGVEGVVSHLIKKNIRNYNDGTFGWGREGSSFYVYIHERTSEISEILREIFYTNMDSQANKVNNILRQIIWFVLLIFGAFNIFGKKTNEKAVISLTLIGVSFFLLIFECRARYLFLFTPLFLILSGTGLNELVNLKIGKKKKH